jgi:hypothetical protein
MRPGCRRAWRHTNYEAQALHRQSMSSLVTGCR